MVCDLLSTANQFVPALLLFTEEVLLSIHTFETDSVSVCIYNELLTVKLFYCHRIERFSSSLVCVLLIFIIFVFYYCFIDLHYIALYYKFGLLYCVHYNKDFIILRFCSINFTLTLAGLENIIHYTEDFVV